MFAVTTHQTTNHKNKCYYSAVDKFWRITVQKYKPLTDLMKTNRELTETSAKSINLPPDYKWQEETPLQDGMMVRHNRCEDGFDLQEQIFAPLTSIADAMTVAAYHLMGLRYTNESAYAGAVVVPYIRYETHFMNLAICRAITIAAGHTTSES